MGSTNTGYSRCDVRRVMCEVTVWVQRKKVFNHVDVIAGSSQTSN